MADDELEGLIPILSDVTALTMGLENVESHPSASGSQIFEDFIDDEHGEKSRPVSTAG